MKATDLIKGDFVHYIGDDYTNGVDIKIKEVREHFVYSSFAADEFYYDEIEPIQLTPEILKKSGFEHCITEEDSDDFDGKQGDLCYVFNKTPEGYMSCVDVTHSFTITGRIKYVHELQHILRLCGIEKEIVL